jgi:hypothetical protein
LVGADAIRPDQSSNIHSIDSDIEKTKDADFGIKYELKCVIKTPDERNPCIVTVWIVENGQAEPKW